MLESTVLLQCFVYLFRFLLLIYFLVFGCPDIPQHPGSHVTIEDNVAVVTCEEDGSVQTLTCVDDVWDGEVLPCVQGAYFN